MVRSTQLAMALLIAVSVAATVATRFGHLTGTRVLMLGATGLVYVAWILYGMREAARFVLWHHGRGPAGKWPSPSGLRSALHVSIQFALAELMIWLAAPAGLGLIWLVLLPPIGFAVMFLPARAIALVSGLSVVAQMANVALWHGWGLAPLALSAFSVTVLFTLLLTQIAVTAERARGEVERLAAELSAANNQLRRYAVQAEELAATRERNRVAREIHDSLGHCLTVVHVQLEAARSTLDQAPEQARHAMDKAQAVARQGLLEIRSSVSALRTPPLQDRPLPEALQQLVADSQVAGVSGSLTVLGAPRVLAPQAAVTIYRAAQEGLTNCRKHSKAASARLTLDYRLPAVVQLAVADDGVGAEQTRDGFGLLGLRERVQLLGGAVRVRTTPGQGFVLEVEVPG